MDLRQPILLTVAILVPAVLLAIGRRRALLGWVCLTLFVQIFDTQMVTNLPTGRIVGILYLPFALLSARKWITMTPARSWLVNFVYLILLGLIWGFVAPWPDITQNRPFSLSAQGRTLIYLARAVTDVCLTVFVAREVYRTNALESLRKALVAGSTVTALFGIASLVLQFDFYHAITGLNVDLSDYARARGLSYEPRGLGLACVYGILFSIPFCRPSVLWLLVLSVNLLGLVISGSTSALALFAAGMLALGLLSANRERLRLVGVAAVGTVCVAGAAWVVSAQFESVVASIVYRLNPIEKLDGARAQTLGEQVAFRLDVFDASALLFLEQEPLYVLSGTGPGLVSLPASYHVPPGVYSSIWNDEVGIDSLPTHGLLLELSNSGLIGLGLWILQVVVCWKAVARLAEERTSAVERREWKLGRVMFCLAIAFYIVQVSISPVWPVLLGLGWAAYARVSIRGAKRAHLGFGRPRSWRVPRLQAT